MARIIRDDIHTHIDYTQFIYTFIYRVGGGRVMEYHKDGRRVICRALHIHSRLYYTVYSRRLTDVLQRLLTFSHVLYCVARHPPWVLGGSIAPLGRSNSCDAAVLIFFFPRLCVSLSLSLSKGLGESRRRRRKRERKIGGGHKMAARCV